MQASTVRTQTADAILTRDLATFVRYVITTCGRDFFQAVDDLELSLSQIKALQLLADADEELSLKDLGDRLGLSMPAMSRAVDGLVRRELVTRLEDQEDRRIKRVRPTPAGRRLMEELVAMRVAGLEVFVAGLSERERAGLQKALAPIVAREEIAVMRPRRRS
jgi:DNA-binding MarR family transcriptional regulator